MIKSHYGSWTDWLLNVILQMITKIQPVFTGREDMPVAFDFSHQGHTLVTLCVQFLCSDWSQFDRWVHAENLCSILKLVYFKSWCDVFNCLFPLNVQNEILLLSRVFCYSQLVCLLGLRNTLLVKVGNLISDGIVRFSPCWMRKRVEKSEAILALLDTFQCISNGKPD